MNKEEQENVQVKAESEVSKQTKEKYESSTMSKAGKLAMELADEKRRLVTELSELQEQYESAKPTTPVGTPDWYVKWSATILAVIGVFIMSAGMVTVGQIMYALAGVCWIFVGMQWSDRAIMIGSAITTTAVCMNLVQTFFG
jgi:hypothetical protein